MIDFDSYIGVKVLWTENNEAEGRIDLKEESFNKIGTVHGGVIMTLADTVCGNLAINMTGKSCTTMDSSINFLNPSLNSKSLIARAKIIKKGKKILTVDCSIFDETDKLIAVSRFSFFVLDKEVSR